MSRSSEDESSDSSGNEYLVTPGKINLDSSFFQQQSSTSKSGTSLIKDDESSDDSDDFVGDNDDKVDSNALLAEVMRNLEKANESAKYNDEETKNSCAINPPTESSPTRNKKNVLSDEITNLLLQGESGVSTSAFHAEEEDEEVAEEKKTSEYTIPKEGVNITLPGTEMMMFGRRKKRGENLEDLLRKRMNQRLRSNQVYVHKVGLMCWLAHGFHLNFSINDAEVLSTALSLVPASGYPKGRVDLKYLEQFTKWFRNLFKLEFRDVEGGVAKDNLLTRLREKKICDYREMVLLYAATLRAIGLNCRIVVSLCAPALKLRRDQLFQNPSESKEDSKKIGKSATAKKEDMGKGKKTVKREKSKNRSDESRPKIVAENSAELRKNAKLDARKRAADVLAQFANSANKKSIKSLTKEKGEEKKVAKSPEKRNEDSKSPTKQSEDDAKSPKNRKEDDAKSPKKRQEDDAKSPPKLRQLRSRAIQQSSKSTADEKSIKIDRDKVKDEISPGKRTRAAKIAKAEVPSTSTMTDSDSDDEFEAKPPVKKKKIIASKSTKKNVEFDDDSEEESKSKLSIKKKKINAKSIEKSVEYDSESSDEFEAKGRETKKKKIIVAKSTKKKIKNDDNSDEDFEPKVPAKKKKVDTSKKTGKGKSKDRDSIDRRVLSSDDEPAELVDGKGAQNIWVEVYVESEESWISVSVVDDKIHCVSEIYKKAPKPVLYVIAWNSVGSLKDVTRRYCPHWLTVTRKQRIDESWWIETLSPWMEKSTRLSRTEDEMLLQRELEQPLPKTVGECKGHPLYALARHLLKFEGIYPPESVPLGHLRTGEAIYSRHCVHTLCSRETWIRKARVVKPAQDAYKIVKSMPKYDKLSGIKLADQPLELFGKWQTTQYVPPVAKDGIVPRNAYGNVDLFKMSMLPTGTVHINLPALSRVAKKLNIDCVPAVVGFNFGARGAAPAIEGYIVCEEFEDTLRAAWQEDQIESAKRAMEKREKRIYGNWKKLIKGLFIRERLAARYDFNDEDDDEDKKPSVSTKRSSKKVLESKKVNGKKSKTS